MAGQCQTTGTCNAGTKRPFAKTLTAFFEKRCQSLLNIGIMSLIICKQDMIIVVDNSDFDCCGTNIDSESVDQIHTSGEPHTSFVHSFMICSENKSVYI